MKEIAWSVVAREAESSTISETVPVAELRFIVVAETKEQAATLARHEIHSRGVNAVSITMKAEGYLVP